MTNNIKILIFMAFALLTAIFAGTSVLILRGDGEKEPTVEKIEWQCAEYAEGLVFADPRILAREVDARRTQIDELKSILSDFDLSECENAATAEEICEAIVECTRIIQNLEYAVMHEGAFYRPFEDFGLSQNEVIAD